MGRQAEGNRGKDQLALSHVGGGSTGTQGLKEGRVIAHVFTVARGVGEIPGQKRGRGEQCSDCKGDGRGVVDEAEEKPRPY